MYYPSGNRNYNGIILPSLESTGMESYTNIWCHSHREMWTYTNLVVFIISFGKGREMRFQKYTPADHASQVSQGICLESYIKYSLADQREDPPTYTIAYHKLVNNTLVSTGNWLPLRGIDIQHACLFLCWYARILKMLQMLLTELQWPQN